MTDVVTVNQAQLERIIEVLKLVEAYDLDTIDISETAGKISFEVSFNLEGL